MPENRWFKTNSDSDSDTSNLSTSFGSNSSFKDNNLKSNINSPGKSRSPIWIPYMDDLLVHRKLFKKGLVVVKPDDLSDDIFHDDNESLSNLVSETEKSFKIKDRNFFFHSPHKVLGKFKPATRELKRAKELQSQLVRFTNNQMKSDDSVVLFNKRHREEIFMPFIFEHEQQKVGMYLYPWTAKFNDKVQFSGFTHFVTAGCLIGASLKGYDQKGFEYALVKHDTERMLFHSGQIITKIMLARTNPYEELLFDELSKIAELISQFSKQKKEESKSLTYHLPYYDYILFGVEMFLRGRITRSALNKFFYIILLKKDQHKEMISNICNKFKIEVKFESPFENIFGHLNIDCKNIDQVIFDVLELDIKMDPVFGRDEEIEREFVQRCLSKLQKNDYNSVHREIWQDFGGICKDDIKSLEELFKVANAIMVAVAAKNRKHYEVCSILPLSEKQIPVGYHTYAKKFLEKSIDSSVSNNNEFVTSHESIDNNVRINGSNDVKYPNVFNITTFEPLIAYSPASPAQGLPFYFSVCQTALSKLITGVKIFQHSYGNVGLFANKLTSGQAQDEKEKPIELQKVLSSSYSPTSSPIFGSP